MSKDYILWFNRIDSSDTLQVGGKGANLGEMANNGFPVPPGFVVSAQAYRDFLKSSSLDQKIESLLKEVKVSDPVSLQSVSSKIKQLIISAPVPPGISREIMSSYLKLCLDLDRSLPRLRRLLKQVKGSDLSVAVRSSATAEDSRTASFAGQNQTFLNIQGEANLVDAVRRCWASLFEGRSIFYREQQHLDHFKSAIAVVVEVMVPSEVSGIVFSIDPVTNNKDRVVIEAVWGLGEYIVQGKVTPDHYEVNKSDLRIVNRQIVPQKILLAREAGGKTSERHVPRSKQKKEKLTDEQVRELAQLAIKLEKHYYFPQDAEFAVAGGRIYLVQTRPITTTVSSEKSKRNGQILEKETKKLEEVLMGAPASPGIRSGPAKVLKNAKEIGKILPGDVLVAEQTNPDYVPAMKKATAIITDKGGRTSHAAIVSRELGIPCVVGTEKATKILKNGEVVTVNGSEGKIYRGAVRVGNREAVVQRDHFERRTPESGPLKTATKVYVNLAEPDIAKEIAAKNVDGVGLLRAEFMLAGIGIHPKKAIEDRTQKLFIGKLAEQISIFAQSFYPRPVIYRATDFKTNEYRSLKGGQKYEPVEENPMIGFRGAYRYIVQPEVFKMEIEAIKRVRETEGFRNLWLMIPFCRTVSELEKVKKTLADNDLHRSPSFKLWLMCEVPSNVILLDKFIELGIDGISIGSNDLTMLTLGVDRDNEHVALEYDERNEAMLQSFEKIIRTCRRFGVSCSMCGQAPSDYPELTEKLVEWGITSVSINPDVIDHTRQVVYEAERKVVSKR